MKVRVLMEPRHGATYDRIVAMAKTTEEAGFDAFFRGDHYLGIDSTDPEYRPTDSWTSLAGVALETSRIKLGTLMTAGTFRHPGVLANAVATVDQMSGGRVILGIGTGWYELLPPKKFDQYLPAARRRFSDQPANYFPAADSPLIPQQTWDQVPSQLGVIGSLAFLALLVGVGRAAWRAARRTPLALAWFGAALGAIAGEALFGGSPLVATFFLVAGVCLALAGLLEADA